MTLTLYGNPFSQCCCRVLVVLYELGLEFTRQNKSQAICRYVVNKYGQESGLVPLSSDIAATARFEMAASIEAFDFDPHASKIWVINYMFPQMRGIAANEARLAEEVGWLEKWLEAYNRILADRKFVAGDTMTLIDFFHFPYGDGLDEAGYGDLLHNYPNVSRWWQEISAHPSWVRVKTEREAVKPHILAALKAEREAK
ncbi:glutathione S-transferase [Auriculariales sp. MPI-PUGE-AT-0066]|nr:glutathione S-transferase [Auriculariales sp. MPI-PUGE-AT-0066]